MCKIVAEKMKESALAALPIGVIILALHFTVAPLPGWTLTMMLAVMAMLLC